MAPTAARRVAAPSPLVASAEQWPVVLYFHHVSPDIDDYTAVTPREFGEALAILDFHFEHLAATRVPDVVAEGGCSRPTCLVTFDDGYADVWRHAVPALEARGWTAIFFVSTQLVGRVEHHPRRGPLAHMDWPQLRTLVAAGHVVASHGATHANLADLAPDRVRWEIEEALGQLAAELPGARDWLAFPYGAVPDPRVLAEVDLPDLCFGSIKAAPRRWALQGHPIRRIYLPVGETDAWPRYAETWSQAQWSRRSR
jgi:peptidoglycan/xylan/chitin deacetylase (PgdA/CDA1 family)